jgi:hypothetical protein
MHRKRLMMDNYPEADERALDILHRRGLPPLSSDFPQFGLTPIGESAQIAQ